VRRIALAVALLGIWLAVPSSATTYYDYWSYWHKPPGATAWQYSKVGPSGYYLQKGTQVEGWRYAIGTASQNDPKPRPVDVTYDTYCTDTGATYQVLLVVDYGTQSGAPKGPVYSCYGFDGDAPNGLQVLTKQHSERDSGGLICAIDNYPKTGCGDVVSSPAPKPSSTTTPKPPATATHTATSNRATAAPTPPDATSSPSSNGAHATRPTATTQPTDDIATPTPSPAATGSPAVVAKQFVPPHRRGGVPFGFIAACVFVVALIGAVWWQRKRRAG
jgi:hypothetical protein